MKNFLLAAGALAIVSSPAHARHHRGHRHHAVYAQHFDGDHYAGSGLIGIARRFVGETAGQLGLPRSLWCADFMNLVMRWAGMSGTGSRLAKSYLALPHTGPRIGAIAVIGRRGGGHVGIVTGFQGDNPIVVSGNHGHRVGESVYVRSRVIAYVSP